MDTILIGIALSALTSLVLYLRQLQNARLDKLHTMVIELSQGVHRLENIVDDDDYL